MLRKTVLEWVTFNDNIKVSDHCKDLIMKLLAKSPKNWLG